MIITDFIINGELVCRRVDDGSEYYTYHFSDGQVLVRRKNKPTSIVIGNITPLDYWVE